MPQGHRPAYPAEFRGRLVELARSGRRPRSSRGSLSPRPRRFATGSRRPTSNRRDATGDDPGARRA